MHPLLLRPALASLLLLVGCGTKVVGLEPTAWDNVVVADVGDAQVVDARRRDAYRAGHIPGAIPVHWTELSALDDDGLWNVLPAEEVGALLDARGVRLDAPVVVVGSGPLGDGDDGNVYWALRWMGHHNVRVLNGGHLGWLSGGGAEESGVPSPSPTESDWTTAPPLLATSTEVAGWDGTVLDVRSAEEFDSGHIPGAVWFEWTDVFDGELIAPEAAVRARLERAGVDLTAPVVTTCRSGIRSGHTFMMLDALGGVDAANYVGSWRRWSAEGRPVER
jgi:thiosulfate/3-mercaptopyruvate sulfurtransferase